MFNMNLIKKLKTSFEIRLSSDGRFLCHNTNSKVVVYDFTTFDKIIELSQPKYPSNLRFSYDNKYLLIKSTQGTICIFETENFQLIKKVRSKKNLKLEEGDDVNFTRDNLLLGGLQIKSGKQIAIFDNSTEGYSILTNFGNESNNTEYNQFVSNENVHLITLSYVNDSDYRVYKMVKVKEPVQMGKVEIIENQEIWYWDGFIYNATIQAYILVRDNYKIVVVDSNFKEVIKEANIEDAFPRSEIGYFSHINQSHNGEFIVITYSETIFILRFDDLQILMVEKIPYAHFAEFSNNGRYLLIGTYENGFILENNLC